MTCDPLFRSSDEISSGFFNIWVVDGKFEPSFGPGSLEVVIAAQKTPMFSGEFVAYRIRVIAKGGEAEGKSHA